MIPAFRGRAQSQETDPAPRGARQGRGTLQETGLMQQILPQRGRKMAVQFTTQQQKVIDARGHNILVSAAAGSGKTAVLVERIIRLITDEQNPVDIDRLLVVTFTRAAAAQMRERIAKAISDRLEKDPENRHLQRQETLLHTAQITTIDSFCAFLLHNNFADIDLDPGFRQMDEMEAKLMLSDTLTEVLEQQYAEKDPEFAWCADYFCPGVGDAELRDRILGLYRRAMSHPWPEAYLAERAEDYAVGDTDDLFGQPWFLACMEELREEVIDAAQEYTGLIALCQSPGGPYPYEEMLTEERMRLLALAGGAGCGEGGVADYAGGAVEHVGGAEEHVGGAVGYAGGAADGARVDDRTRPEPVRTGEIGGFDSGKARAKSLWQSLSGLSSLEFGRLPAIRKTNTDVDPESKDAVSGARTRIRKKLKEEAARFFADSPDETVRKMHAAERPLRELVHLTEKLMEVYAAAKEEKNVIDFDDLEHFALRILCRRGEDGKIYARPAAETYRAHFAEILCDEYQDSNDVQELLLSMISRESEGQRNRFMVGDVKQSIYKFRLARPEIFMEKYRTFRPDDPENERIDLDRNFRSRAEVLDPVNAIFRHICRTEVGGVEYDEAAALKAGNTSFPPCPEARAELLVINRRERDAEDGAEEEEEESDSSRRIEAKAIALRIRELVGHYPVTDEETHALRPARYGDIVVLLRATAGWDEDFRSVFEENGVPCYVAARAGYFQTEEIREVIQYLRVLDNPRQDIPLYGAMRGYFGGFDEEELALIRAENKERGTEFYTAVCRYAGVPVLMPDGGETEQEPWNPDDRVGGADEDGRDPALIEKCRRFLEQVDRDRALRTVLPIHELLTRLVIDTGYEDYITALPSGAQRAANLRMLLGIAQNFEKTAYTGLFQFLRYMDQMKAQEVDFGEANTLDENADVVRIMTIHKSKGLEFPICFVAGLAKRMNRRDIQGRLIADDSLGVGMDFADPEERVTSTTLRKEVIADRIRRDSMGEELRVLYVAMTRAKEKLILTGLVKDYDKEKEEAELRTPAFADKIPVSGIMDAADDLTLILEGIAAAEKNGEDPAISVTVRDSTDLAIQREKQQYDLGKRREAVQDAAQKALRDGISGLPDPVLGRELERRFSWQYAHGALEGLYTKTTVTELKEARGRSAWSEEEGEALRQDGRSRYPEKPADPYLPTFAGKMRKENGEEGEKAASRGRDDAGKNPGEENGPEDGKAARRGSGDTSGQNRGQNKEEGVPAAVDFSSAARGTIIHRCMQLLDYCRFPHPAAVTEDAFLVWRTELVQTGQILAKEAALLEPALILPFLRTPLAERMAEADRKGHLRREQPFVMGIPANRLKESFPAEETVLIQGIIDAYFEEDGQITVVDYKTDRVRESGSLVDRYSIQLDCYAEALSRMIGLPVREKLIYSFALGEIVPLP